MKGPVFRAPLPRVLLAGAALLLAGPGLTGGAGAAGNPAAVPFLPVPRPDAVAAAPAPASAAPAASAPAGPAAVPSAANPLAADPLVVNPPADGAPAGRAAAKADLAPPQAPDRFAAFQVVAAQAVAPKALRTALRNAGLEPMATGTGDLMAADGEAADTARPLAMLPAAGSEPVLPGPATGFTEVAPSGRRAIAPAEPLPAESVPAEAAAPAPDEAVPVALMPAPRPAVAEAAAMQDDETPDAPLPQPRPAVAEVAVARAEPEADIAAPMPAQRPRRPAVAEITAQPAPPAAPAARTRLASLPGAELRAAPGGTLPGASLSALPGTQGAPLTGKAAGGLPAACAQLVRSGLAKIEPSTRRQAGGACRVPDLVELSALRLADGRVIDLKPSAAVNCRMALAVVNWVRGDIAPAVARLGSPLETLHVAASYSCRPMNRQRGNRLSEHGRGNALDVGGYTLANGEHYVIRGRSLPASFRVSMRQSACARFETVLGPGSDGFHEEHIHVDLANRPRAWAACRWKIPDAPVASRTTAASGG